MMIEPYAYLHLALDAEAPSAPEFKTLMGVNWKRLSSQTYGAFLSLAVILAGVSVAETAQALISVGDTGGQVRQVQLRLRELGYFHAKATGYYGPITHDAVFEFQLDQGLFPDGVVGHQTLSALKLNTRPPHPKPQPQHYHPVTEHRHLIGLGVGDHGPGVQDLQKRLKQLGFFHAHPTGYFGSITRHAVIEFQKNCSLPGTGLVTEETLAALNKGGREKGHSAILLPSRFLRQGDVDISVGILQRRLQKLGYYHGLITQSYNAETAEAVRNFQMDNGIQMTGVVGPTTEAYIVEKIELTSSPDDEERFPGDLQFGTGGDAVQYLQRQLRSRGYYTGEISGEFDLTTRQALVNFQQDNGMTQTGQVNVSTWYRLAGVQPRFRMASLPSHGTPIHPFAVTDTFIELGDVGAEVRTIQRQLRQLNYYHGPIDGFYGPGTERAVLRFQRANRLTQTGIVGPTTRTYLFNAQSPEAQPEPEEEMETGTETETSSRLPLSTASITANPHIPTASVQQVQQRLKTQGLYNGPIDGVYNEQTRMAMTQAKQLYGASANVVLFGGL